MRKLKILEINASTAETPGSIKVASDYSGIFKGRFYRDDAGAVQPAYTTPAPAGYTLIAATTFDIIGNAKYDGRYTVYTPVSDVDETPSSEFTDGETTIFVAEAVPALGAEDPPALESDGHVTNISTYLLYTGTTTIVVPPGVNLTNYPIEFMGRGSSGWGEAYAQNYVNLARNFAHGLPPANPFVGQLWFDTDDNQVRAFDGVGWDVVNRASFGTTFRHTQGTPSTTWTVNHLLGLQAPYICFAQFFIDVDGEPQLILPANVTFNSANQLTATFTDPQVGYVLVRP